MESHNLYRVKEEDLDKLIRILTVCFSEDPLYHALIPDRDTRERLMPELFTCDLTEFFETCEIYADSSELNSILVVSDGTEHEAALHNLMVDFFCPSENRWLSDQRGSKSCDPAEIHPGKRLSEFQLDFPASYSRKASCDLSGSGAEDAASRSC